MVKTINKAQVSLMFCHILETFNHPKYIETSLKIRKLQFQLILSCSHKSRLTNHTCTLGSTYNKISIPQTSKLVLVTHSLTFAVNHNIICLKDHTKQRYKSILSKHSSTRRIRKVSINILKLWPNTIQPTTVCLYSVVNTTLSNIRHRLCQFSSPSSSERFIQIYKQNVHQGFL